jgi:tetratricopeptide (TPR) repeat protein
MKPVHAWMAAAALALGGPAAAADTVKDATGKIGSAMGYLDKLGRPVPAEEDLRDAEAICNELHDDECLGRVWLAWGYYFRSDALTRWKGAKAVGPALYDRSVTYAQRYERSIQYYDKALQLYDKRGNPHWITKVELEKAFAYHSMGRLDDTCRSLQASRDADTKYENGKSVGPPGKTFAQYLDDLWRGTRCDQPDRPATAASAVEPSELR